MQRSTGKFTNRDLCLLTQDQLLNFDVGGSKIMEKFINDRFCDNIDGSSYRYLHGRLILNALKYLWEHVETACENYIVFNGRREGEYKMWYKNGQLLEQCTYANGKLEGEHKIWCENGQLWEQCAYLDGKEKGEYKSWYTNGQFFTQCTYVNGKLEGECKIWHRNGQFIKKCFYVNGEQKSKCIII